MRISPGMHLGRYEIVAPLGAGGMGEVYKGLDTLLGRSVAIKVLPERIAADEESRHRFEREAKLLAALSHLNILAIHDFGTEQGIAFAVMELLEGETLRQTLKRGPLDTDTALAYAREIARGLAAAHAKAIIHRDLKPENVFLPAGGPVKILDFGLARLDERQATSRADTGLHAVTTPGMTLGTVDYMSPEQIRGGETDLRSDIFSFGVMLHEMLSGVKPFAARSPVDTMSAILNLDPPPLPAALSFVEPVVRVCLQKQPEKRYQSARDLVAALEELKTVSRSASVASRAQPRRGTARDTPHSIAVLAFADMSADKNLDYLCEGIAEEIISALTKVDGLRVVARSSAFQFKGEAEDIRTVGRLLSVESVLDGSVRAAGDRLRIVTQLVNAADGYQLWSERFDRTLGDVFAVQDEIASAVAATLRVRMQEASGTGTSAPPDPEAYTLYLKGLHHWNKRTEADLKKSVEYFTAAIDRDPDYAQAHAGLAEAYATLGLYGAMPPDQSMPRAKASAEHAMTIAPMLSSALSTLGVVSAVYEWSWPAAEQHFRRALELTPGSSSVRHWYAINFLVPLGRFEEADVELRRALEVDPLSLPISSGFGVRSYFAHRYAEAAQELSKSLELDAGFVVARYFLGLTLAELGQLGDAVRELETAIRTSGGSPEMTAALGYAVARAGEPDRARRALAELSTLSRTRHVSPSLIAQIHAGLGERDEALSWLEKARAMRVPDLAWLAVRPVFASLRTEARFKTLLQALSLQK